MFCITINLSVQLSVIKSSFLRAGNLSKTTNIVTIFNSSEHLKLHQYNFECSFHFKFFISGSHFRKRGPPPPIIRQLYHTESLHPLAHPVTHAVVKETKKETLCNYNFSNIHVLPCSLHYLLAYAFGSLMIPLRLVSLHNSIKYFVPVFVFLLKSTLKKTL